eukprot:scaffold285651_cov32-Tisochrysis_lutea.AAC.1
MTCAGNTVYIESQPCARQHSAKVQRSSTPGAGRSTLAPWQIKHGAAVSDATGQDYKTPATASAGTGRASGWMRMRGCVCDGNEECLIKQVGLVGHGGHRVNHGKNAERRDAVDQRRHRAASRAHDQKASHHRRMPRRGWPTRGEEFHMERGASSAAVLKKKGAGAWHHGPHATKAHGRCRRRVGSGFPPEPHKNVASHT